MTSQDDDLENDEEDYILAGINEVCEGFNESTGQPYPGCEEGLVCVDSGTPSIPGAGNVCKHDFGCFFG